MQEFVTNAPEHGVGNGATLSRTSAISHTVPTATYAAPPRPKFFPEVSECVWAQCATCSKWRRLTDAVALPERLVRDGLGMLLTNHKAPFANEGV